MYSASESSLIASCLDGNRKAQQRLYRQYCDAMYNVCYRMLGTEAEAEDALQEAFVDVFHRLDTFRQESSLGAWIKRIVINHCLNVHKKKRIDTVTWDTLVHEPPEEIPVDESHLTYEVHRVREAIMRLPDGYRQVLTLYLIEGYDHAEIAQIMGIQETGSKSQYSRAKARLRELLQAPETRKTQII
jgi:RNA polymerase sigma-70 factor (ECF subfamily)